MATGENISRRLWLRGAFLGMLYALKRPQRVTRLLALCVDGVFRLPTLPAVSPELLEILVCPRTKKKLVLADSATLERVNALIRSGNCREISGAAVHEPASEGLFEPENNIFYFVRDDIPVLIYDNAVKLG